MTLDLDMPATQEQFAALVGVSQQTVSDLVARDVLPRGANAGVWLTAYCSNLREQAAGRSGSGELVLVDERARLASEQADRVAMQNARDRKLLAPVSVITECLARVSRQVVGILEAIPIDIKRRDPTIGAEALEIITREIVRARQLASKIEIEVPEGEDGPLGDS